MPRVPRSIPPRLSSGFTTEYPTATRTLFLTIAMVLETPFRPATIGDCYDIARLFKIASGGVAEYTWTTMQADYPGLSPLRIGERRYASDTTVFTYKNAIVASHDDHVMGVLVTFAIAAEVDGPSETPDPILAPYSLEAPGSWYICAMAVFPEFRGQGLGTKLLAIARDQAQEGEFNELSLLVFEQNTGAVRLYERNGFKTVDRAAVVPHPLIQYTGDVLLMTVPV